MNTKPKKPEKKSWKEQSNCWDKISGIQICQEEGYNEACDDWNKYHEWDKAQNYISKDRLPSIKELEGIIEKTAVEYNKNKITPDFIWKCSLTDLAKAIKARWEGKL